MSRKYDKSIIIKILSIIMGLCVGGFAWRLRGDDGYGSFWGLVIVGTMLTLVVFAVYGDRIKMKSELIPIGGLMAGAAVTGYGTLMLQFSGVLMNYINEEPYITFDKIDAKSGTIIWAMMSFTLAPLFALFIGTLFTKKKDYKCYHYIIFVAVYLGVSYICKASIAHHIVYALCPDQVAYTVKGLAQAGITDLTPMQVYLRHFASRSFAESIPYFENYYMTVETVSKFISVFVTFLFVLIAYKDTLSFLVGLFINTVTAAGSVLFSCFLATEYELPFIKEGATAGPLAFSSLPYWVTSGGVWAIWEFGVGLSLGLATMFIIAVLPKKYTEGTSFRSRPYIDNKFFRFIFNFIGFTFVFGVVPFRAFGRRLGDLIEIYKEGIGGTIETVVVIAGSVLLGLYFLVRFKKEILNRNMPVPFEMKPQKFACIALPCFVLANAINYLFFGKNKYFMIIPFSSFKDGIKAGLLSITSDGHIVTLSVFFAAIICLIISIPVYKRQSK